MCTPKISPSLVSFSLSVGHEQVVLTPPCLMGFFLAFVSIKKADFFGMFCALWHNLIIPITLYFPDLINVSEVDKQLIITYRIAFTLDCICLSLYYV